MQLHIGVSAFSEPKWKGKFYPPKLPQKEMLPYYVQHFDAVEINNTFYKMPVAANLAAWTAQVPSNFRFALKAPQTITHFKRLKEDAAEPTTQLFQVVAALKDRLGPILFGLHPNHKKDVLLLKAFLKRIPPKAKVAFEFRHASWFDDEVFNCLRQHRAALCIAHTDDFPKPELIATTNWGYLRLHRKRYTNKDLAQWLAQIQSQPWKECYVFFKHEETGSGPRFAARLLELVNKRYDN